MTDATKSSRLLLTLQPHLPRSCCSVLVLNTLLVSYEHTFARRQQKRAESSVRGQRAAEGGLRRGQGMAVGLLAFASRYFAPTINHRHSVRFTHVGPLLSYRASVAGGDECRRRSEARCIAYRQYHCCPPYVELLSLNAFPLTVWCTWHSHGTYDTELV